MFKRKIYEKMLSWKKEWNGTRALLIEGARRVGKSTVVKEFAKKEYRSCIIIDFGLVSKDVKSIFDDLTNLDLFFLRLQTIFNTTLYPRESVIVFDEVQLFPRARQAIKYLVQDGRYDYIETGSLISIRKNVKDILIPSEEEKLEMHPMDYEEFCGAVGFDYSLLLNLKEVASPLGDAAHRKLMRDFRIYMAVGGMPQAVASYVEGNSFEKIDAVKKSIIKLYMDDLMKVDPSGRLSSIFLSVPAQLCSKRSGFSLNRAVPTKRTRKDDERLFDLVDSKTVNIARRVNEPSLALSQSVDLTSFKLYLSDTGLFVSMLFSSEDKNHEDIYWKLLNDKLDTNLGYLYENVAAQLLVASGRQLYFHTWAKENSVHKYEIDFLVTSKGKVCPIEVKSGKVKNHESLDAFAIKYSRVVGERYLVSQKDIHKNSGISYWPIYLLPLFL